MGALKQLWNTSKKVWFDSSWKYRRKIVINNYNVNKTLTNFQVNIQLTNSNFSFLKAKSDGSDIRITSDELKKIYHEFGTELLVTEPKLFDQFTKDGRTSYAFRLVFQSYDQTLTDDEVSKIMANISKKIESLGWQIR